MHGHSLVPAAFALALTPGLAGAVTTTVTASGATAADIQMAVEDFRTLLGDLNPFEPQNFPDGRRQIDWDAAPDAVSDPNPFPGDFFNFSAAPRARGIEFQETGATTGFRLSSTAASGVPVEFGFPDDFTVFSPERLFTPVDGTGFSVLFFDPVNQTTPATTRGLGVVFTDVEQPGSASMTFFDRDGMELASALVPTSGNGGLSFLGIAFDNPVVAQVDIVSGDIPIDSSSGETDGDRVVMDDFIFGEPAPIPLPGGFVLLAGALAGVIGLARRRAA